MSLPAATRPWHTDPPPNRASSRPEDDSRPAQTIVDLRRGKHDPDPLLAFDAEDGDQGARATAPAGSTRPAAEAAGAPLEVAPRGARGRTALRASLISGAILAAAAGGAIAYNRFGPPAPPSDAAASRVAGGTGTAMISSDPAGAAVIVDGTVRGVTPLTLSLPAGAHSIDLSADGQTRSLPLTVEAGATSSQYVELGPAPPSSGRVEISSDPAGAFVALDGVARGQTPLVLGAVSPGLHRLVITDGHGGRVARALTVEAGTTSTVMTSLIQETATNGWVFVKAPFEVQIFERDRLVGTSGSEPVMLPAGHHDLDVVEASLGLRSRIGVDVLAGKTVSTTPPLPMGSVSINALPWADVTVDGHAVGSTPIGNLPLSIGRHDIVWRHPQLGERRQTVTVIADAVLRVGADFSQ